MSPYEAIGGDAAVLTLVSRFYEIMDTEPQTAGIRAMHPPDLSGSKQKLYEFLSGWLGGPSLYIERHGHPRLRARHLPFPITESERDQWLFCMQAALTEVVPDETLRHDLYGAFARLADHMRNRS